MDELQLPCGKPLPFHDYGLETIGPVGNVGSSGRARQTVIDGVLRDPRLYPLVLLFFESFPLFVDIPGDGVVAYWTRGYGCSANGLVVGEGDKQDYKTNARVWRTAPLFLTRTRF